MIRHWLSLSPILFLLLYGSGCAAPQVIDPVDCVPDVIVQEKLIELDPDLTTPQPCPEPPHRGNVSVLLDWAENCAISAQLANDQLKAIRELQR